MSRSVSDAAIRAMFAQETTDGFLVKLMLEHADFDQPYRFVNDIVQSDVNGDYLRTDAELNEWICFPFEITLPDDRDDEIGQARLSICNVDRQIVQAIRQISTPPTVTMWVCLLTDIDDIIAGPFEFNLDSVSWDALAVSGSLTYEPILNMRWPRDDYTPLTVPGLFKV